MLGLGDHEVAPAPPDRPCLALDQRAVVGLDPALGLGHDLVRDDDDVARPRARPHARSRPRGARRGRLPRRSPGCPSSGRIVTSAVTRPVTTIPLCVRWSRFTLTRTAVNGSSQRATSSGPASTALPETTSPARRAASAFASASSPQSSTSSASGSSRRASAFALSVWKPATRRASGAARAASSASDSSPGSANARRSRTPIGRGDADHDLPGQERGEVARRRLDARGRDGEHDDLGALRRLGVRDDVALRAARADHDLLARGAQPGGEALGEAARAADEADHSASRIARPTDSRVAGSAITMGATIARSPSASISGASSASSGSSTKEPASPA